MAWLGLNFVPLLYFPDHDLTSIKGCEAALGQDWHNSSQHLGKCFEFNESTIPYQYVFAANGSNRLNHRKNETSFQYFGINLICYEADVKYEGVLQD